MITKFACGIGLKVEIQGFVSSSGDMEVAYEPVREAEDEEKDAEDQPGG